jgi:hypothetical protein
VTEDLCKHDMNPAYCAFCRPLPVGVLARGFRTKGGDAYHNDAHCEWMRKGQRFAERRGREVHDIEPIAWHSVTPGQLAPCEACCTPQWIKRHERRRSEKVEARGHLPTGRRTFVLPEQRQGEHAADFPSSGRADVQAVWVDLTRLFGSSAPSSVPGGLVLEVVHGDLARWARSADGAWIGVVTWTGRTAEGDIVRASDQWVPAHALRPRRG